MRRFLHYGCALSRLRFACDAHLLDELSFACEQLNPVVDAIGHVDDAIAGDFDGVRQSEFRRTVRRRLR